MLRATVTLLLILWPHVAFTHEVTVIRNVNFRTVPNASSSTTIIKLLEPGDRAKLLEVEKFNGYYRVVRKGDGVGFVWANNVRVLPEYLRTDYMPSGKWSDADGDCQRTRDEVLIAESTTPATFTSGTNCKVAAGSWNDPYTGLTFTDPGDVDIDHMVPLKNAHISGAWAWTYERKQEYANDLANPEHLIAVDDATNQAKGAKGPEEWTPPNAAHHCQYAREWER